MTPAAPIRCQHRCKRLRVPGNCVNNGHPEDKYGWALAGGAKFNLPGGDMIGFNVCYAEGAPGFCTNNAAFQLYNTSNSVGAGWIADGVFANGTQIELTKVWSALAAYEHIWNPKWRTSFFGGYVNVNYNDNATDLIQQRLPGVAVGCGRAAIAPALSTIQPARRATAAAPTTTSGKPAHGRSGTRCRSSISVSKCCYSKRNTAFKGPAIVPASGSRPPVFVLDDQDAWSAMFRWQRNFYP